MNSKHSVVFFSVGVILILGMILMGFMPMNTSNIVVPDSQQITPIDAQMELFTQNNDDELTLQDDDDNADTAKNAKNMPAKSVDQMNCVELKDLAMSFEKGWGSAVAIYDEKCS